tara:strand:+ start:341 stop:721 length:381 start_codon:yes stop_codon:yes gene_type:complete
MFGLGKLEVLESKLSIYEDLSKEMLDKLERAVSSIQESSNKVAIILERHENRLDEGEKASDATLKLVDKMQADFNSLESKVESLSKFRWVTLGVVASGMVILNVLQIIGPRIIRTSPPQTTIQQVR